jgi:hypothetical protein
MIRSMTGYGRGSGSQDGFVFLPNCVLLITVMPTFQFVFPGSCIRWKNASAACCRNMSDAAG